MNTIDEMRQRLQKQNEQWTNKDIECLLHEYAVLETRYNRLKESLVQCGIDTQRTIERIVQKISSG